MKKVLIVDDNPTNLRILEMLLKKQDCRVIAFSDGYKCLNWVDEHVNSLDLAILDYEMEAMNGDELAAAIRKRGFTGNCLILTALGTLNKTMLAPGSRIQAILNKPINLSDIAYIIKRWASVGQEGEARSENRLQDPETEEIFLFQDGTYHELNVTRSDSSSRGKGYRLLQGKVPVPGEEVILKDGQNYSIRWVKSTGHNYHFGACRIEPMG